MKDTYYISPEFGTGNRDLHAVVNDRGEEEYIYYERKIFLVKKE